MCKLVPDETVIEENHFHFYTFTFAHYFSGLKSFNNSVTGISQSESVFTCLRDSCSKKESENILKFFIFSPFSPPFVSSIILFTFFFCLLSTGTCTLFCIHLPTMLIFDSFFFNKIQNIYTFV